MIIWINGAFGAGKTTIAAELNRRISQSYVYDPENLGYFLRENTPGLYADGDFQDIPVWRTGNAQVLSMLARDYDGVLLVPMTLVHPDYHDEIIGTLRREGHTVYHIILSAERETLLSRLRHRSGSLKREAFAVDAIERCLAAFAAMPEVEKIPTDGRHIADITEDIAARCGISLTPDTRCGLRRRLDRLLTTIRHIRR